MSIRYSLLLITIIILAGFVTIWPTLQLSLYGDDWNAFWRYHQTLYTDQFHYNHLSYFVTPYGAQDITMGLLRRIFGYHSSSYYLLSLITRIIAACSLIPLTLRLTQSRLAAALSSLLFVVTTTGLETTDWVFNMPSYLSISCFSLWLYYFLTFFDNYRIRYLLFSFILFYLAHIFSPIRMVGLLPFSLFVSTLLAFERKNYLLKATVINIVIFVFISLTGKIPGVENSLSNQVFQIAQDGLKTLTKIVGTGHYETFTYPIITLGELILPNHLIPNLWQYYYPQTAKILLLWHTTIVVGIALIYTYRQWYQQRWQLIGFLTINFLLTLMASFFYSLIKPYLTLDQLLLIFIGIDLLTIFGLGLITTKTLTQRFGLLIAGFWIIFSFGFTWIRGPDTLMPTVHRYLIVTAIGISLLIGWFIGRQTGYQKVVTLILVAVLLSVQLWGTRTAINQMLSLHNQKLMNQLWSKTPDFSVIQHYRQPIIIYLIDHNSYSAAFYMSFGFNIDRRLGVIYNVYDPSLMPVLMDNWDELVSATTDGKSLSRFGDRKTIPIPIDYVYAFSTNLQNELIDETDQIRQKLHNEL